MTSFFKTDLAPVSRSGNNSLQSLVNELLNDLRESAALNKIVVETDIPVNLCLQAAYRHELVPIISDLLRAMVSNARNTSLCITAEKYSGIVTLRVEDRNNYNGYALSFSLMPVVRQARCIGGEIITRGAQERVASVSFSFPDVPQVKGHSCRAYA
jgi:hypothetical protein